MLPLYVYSCTNNFFCKTLKRANTSLKTRVAESVSESQGVGGFWVESKLDS